MKKQTDPVIVKFYFFSHEILLKIFLLCKTCFTGLWLGLLSREKLHLIDNQYYNNCKIYCEDEYNSSGLKSWEKKVIDKYFYKCNSVLITSVGGGREVLALRQKGFEADGFECNQSLVECANNLLRKEGFVPNIQFVPRDKCSDATKIYDGLIIGWGAYTLIQGKEQRIDFLKDLRNQTGEQAPILLSFFHRSNIVQFKIIITISNILRWILHRKLLDVGDNMVPNYAHYFTVEEIRTELNSGGFELELYSTDDYGHAVGYALPKFLSSI